MLNMIWQAIYDFFHIFKNAIHLLKLQRGTKTCSGVQSFALCSGRKRFAYFRTPDLKQSLRSAKLVLCAMGENALLIFALRI